MINLQLTKTEKQLLHHTLIRWSTFKKGRGEVTNQSPVSQGQVPCSCDAEFCIDGLCSCPCISCKAERSSISKTLLPVIASRQTVSVLA